MCVAISWDKNESVSIFVRTRLVFAWTVTCMYTRTCPITVVPLHVATADHGDFVCHPEDDKPTLLVFHLLGIVVTDSTANKSTASDSMTPLYMYRLSAGAYNRNIDK